ncbi:hypothetical protein Thini_0690 [Thiothrix nivea DSM 5205]|uniref:Uncharacterized protein n=2 Tax=Thiothrix nivea TaxID=1031 RepID=A0A656HAK7_THINJ|nr:hypothetical protein Thini_0690 [Thiothrix nivea DSM 5205]
MDQVNTSGLAGWLEIFRAGTRADSKGVERTFTQADLEQIVNNSWSGDPIPHVITHQELYSPFAYAKSPEIRVNGDLIESRQTDIEPQFEKLVKDGRLYSRSVRMIPTERGWKITHIAWLGAEPPAVEGLAPVQFSADGNPVDFSYPIKSTSPEDGMTDKGKSGGDAGYTQADVDRMVNEAKQAAAAEFSSQKAALEAELKVERDSKARAEWQATIDKACTEGRLTPAQAEGMADFALQLPATAIEFSRGDDSNKSTVKTDAKQWFADFVGKLPKQVAMASDAGGDGQPGVDKTDADAIASAAVEYQAAMSQKGIIISASQAVAHVVGGSK